MNGAKNVFGIWHRWPRCLLNSRSTFPCQDHAQSSRQLSTGLFFIPSKPLEVHPTDSATIATLNFIKDNGRELLLYEALQSHGKFPPAPTGVALALFSDYSNMKHRLATAKVPALPAVDAQRWILEEALDAKQRADDAAEDQIDSIESESFVLPPELRPQLMDDGIPLVNYTEAEWEEWAAWEAERQADFDDSWLDAADYQNTLPDYDPYQSNQDCVENGRAWIEADKVQCLMGARARLYHGFDVSKDITENRSLESKVWDPKPLNGESDLAPYLFLTQIPCSPSFTDDNNPSPPKTDEEFLPMFHRYGYLTSDDSLRRISCFRQDDPEFPRWLLVQESDDFRGYDHALKKQEAELWWRKNGWEGTVMEFFRLKEKESQSSHRSPVKERTGREYEKMRGWKWSI